MIRQWTRILYRPDGSPVHVYSQLLPLDDDLDPVSEVDLDGNSKPHGIVDFEMDVDLPRNNNVMGGKGPFLMRAREILENFEVPQAGGRKPQLKANASDEAKAKVLRVGPPKAINESVVLPELAQEIRLVLIAGGGSEAEVMAVAGRGRLNNPTKIEELPAGRVLRMAHDVGVIT